MSTRPYPAHLSPHRRAAVAAMGVVAALAITFIGVAAQAGTTDGYTTATAAASAGPSTRIAVSKATVAPGTPLKVTGRVPAKSYRTVQLHSASSAATSWTKLGTSTTARTGTFVFKFVAPTRPGTYNYRVYAPRTRVGSTRAPAVTTKTVTVAVRDPLGSRTNPVELGQTFRLRDWDITVHGTDYDTYPDADHDITDPPEPGWTFISYSATFTYHGDHGSTPDMDLSIDFLATNQRVYDAYSGDNVCGNAEPDLDDVDDMYTGATVTGNDCVSVPTSLAYDGLWRFDAYLGDREIFVRAN